MNDFQNKSESAINFQKQRNTSGLFWLLIAEIAIIFFFVPAGRFDFRPYGLGFSTGFNAYKLFPVIFLTWGIWRWRNPKKQWPVMPFLIPFASFVFFTFMASVASPEPYQSLSEFLELLLYLFFFVIMLDIPWSTRAITVVACGFLVGNFYMGGVAILEFIQAMQNQAVPRIDATYDFPNALVVYCILGFTLLMWVFFKSQSIVQKIIILCAVIVVLFCAVASISRGTFIAFIALAITLFVLGDRQLKFTGMGILGILIVFSLIYTPEIIQRFLDILQEPEQKNLASRFYIWPAILDLEVPDFSFFGVGMGPLIFNQMASANVAMSNPHVLSEAWHAHSLYLQLFFATGVMGLFSFIWLFWQVIVNLLKKQTLPNIILLAGLIAFLAHQTIEIHLLVGNIPIALFTLIAIASKETADSKEPIN